MAPLIDLSIGALSPTGTFAPGTNVTVSADVHLNDGFAGLVQTSFFFQVMPPSTQMTFMLVFPLLVIFMQARHGLFNLSGQCLI
jgi:hypothetical protein